MTDEATAAACLETAELLKEVARDVRAGAERLGATLDAATNDADRWAIRNHAMALQVWGEHRGHREVEVEFSLVVCDAERAIVKANPL